MPLPVVTGISPKEGPPGTRVTIRGEFLGNKQSDIIGLWSVMLFLKKVSLGCNGLEKYNLFS